MKKAHIIHKPPTKVHPYRCNDEQYSELQAKAKECGISLSRYMVETGLKHHPRQRLTKEEVDALNSLMIARGDLVNVTNALKALSDEEKLAVFHTRAFMQGWVDAVNELVQHWYSIEENISDSVQTREEPKKRKKNDNACKGRTVRGQLNEVRVREGKRKKGQGKQHA